MRALLGRLALVVLSLGMGLAVAEGAFAFLLDHAGLAARLPGNVLSHLRAYYLHHDRELVQSQPACSRYDPGLFYTLRPGQCRFKNREYDTTLRINSVGLRDDEAALQAPEVIALGDSFAMGWGVEQEEAFPQQLARLSGRRVLNAGIPSYGTVREVRLLDRIDTGRLRVLVVQYDDNDSEENRLYFERGNQLRVNPELFFVHDLQRAGRRQRYHFGKYTFELVRGVVAPEKFPTPPVLTPQHQARLFVNALVHASARDLSAVQVLVVDLNADRLVSGELIEAIQREAVRAQHPDFVRRLRVVDLSGHLRPEDYFVLDDHLRPSGHRKVAERLFEKLRETGF
jgi:hypothetical protein